ncbi:MAG: ATP-dependent sacrificial sulfur transferase LarE [Spirochaetota bacterium]
MEENLKAKLEKLREVIITTGGCAVAYSGGVDSSLVLSVAKEVLGDRCVAVIAESSTYSRREFNEAVGWVKKQEINYRVIHSEELDIPEFSNNPPERCYHCKKELFKKVWEVARQLGFGAVLDGTNADDLLDYRPGIKAAGELGVISPLMEAGITKNEVRKISREVYRLPMADKPAMPCLATRFAFGSSITRYKLKQIEAIEDQLYNLGFRNFRARHHGDILRIEVGQDELRWVLDEDLRRSIIRFSKEMGFTYVTIDLEGYRMGSMNIKL